MRVLIVGCGYVGSALGTELLRLGHEVFGVRRSAESAAALAGTGIKPVVADITRREDLNAIPLPFDWVVNTTSSSKGDVDDYREVYLQGTRNLVDWLSAAPPKKFVYTSSTGVYGQMDGSLVSESSSAQPSTPTAQVLIETEKVLLDAARTLKFPAVILRVAGIYGPGRGYHLTQFLKGEAKIAGQGERLMNMIHRDDVVGAILAALKSGRAGEIYNAVDDEPVPQVRFYRWLAESLAEPMPPVVSESLEAERKRGVTNKKVSNRRLKMELGYQFKFPTFRQGCTAEIKRLEDLGEL